MLVVRNLQIFQTMLKSEVSKNKYLAPKGLREESIIMRKTNTIEAMLQEIIFDVKDIKEAQKLQDARITALEKAVKKPSNTNSSSKTSTKSQKKAPKTPKKSAPKSSKVNLADFEPKKDSDGHYNWASYKACRRRYVEEVSGKKLHGKDGEWIEGETFKKFAKDFDKAYKYVKKSDR